MQSNLLVRNEEKQYGPLNWVELKTLVKRGKFSSSDQVWLEDEDEWVQADNIKELDHLFNKDVFKQEGKKIIAIGSGKGGVGKTVTAASLGIGLAALGQEVILVDADFGDHVQKGFFGGGGFTLDEGLTDTSRYEVELKRRMIERSKEVIAVVDSSKWGQVTFASLAPVEQVDRVIADDAAPDEMVEALRARGVRVSLV